MHRIFYRITKQVHELLPVGCPRELPAFVYQFTIIAAELNPSGSISRHKLLLSFAVLIEYQKRKGVSIYQLINISHIYSPVVAIGIQHDGSHIAVVLMKHLVYPSAFHG